MEALQNERAAQEQEADEAAEREMEAELERPIEGFCVNVVATDPDTGEDVLCGEPCNPNEQLCHFCRTSFHRIHL